MSFKPLQQDEFRLMIILPDADHEPLRCRVSNERLSDDVDYYALSYRCGPPGLDEELEHNGHTLKVDINLSAALRELRRLWRTQQAMNKLSPRLWTFSTCINQKDKPEKSRQVLRIGKVFASATKVIAWLGPEGDNSDEAMDLIEQLASLPFDPCTSSEVVRRLQEEDPTSWTALFNWFERSYWERVWMFPEITLAKDIQIHCGQKNISWDTLLEADQFLGFYHWRFDTGKIDRGNKCFQLQKLNRRFRANQKKQVPLSIVLLSGQTFLATKPVDKIYALLSLASNGSKLVPNPDYKMPLEDVFADTTRAIIVDSGFLEFICLGKDIGMRPEVAAWESWPSWAPFQFETGQTIAGRAILLSGYSTYRDTFNATRGYSAKIDPTPSRTLGAMGIFHSTVVTMDYWSPPKSDQQLEQEVLSIVKHMNDNKVTLYTAPDEAADTPYRPVSDAQARDILKSVKDKRKLSVTPIIDKTRPFGPYKTLYDLFSALERTIWRAATGSAFDKSIDEHFLAVVLFIWAINGDALSAAPVKASATFHWIHHQKNFIFNGKAIKDWILEGEIADLQRRPGSPVNIDELISYLSKDHFIPDILQWTKKLFVSSSGHVGIADSDVQPSDMIFLLQGCCVPVVLRPLRNGFKVLFEVYLDGIMLGEAMEGLVESDWKDVALY